ncbi:hypothetical protein NKS28_13640 [Bacillus sp. 1663tsa1]|uniref:hypothetical protein n=1 Tax=Bacillus sp. 1663tsa1 TaxID=2953804 RepID=UPI0020A224F5|nr:hypothetical protein [Bacillus sp. 1663tsa1]MCP1178519.1 hypothetical protein [Bacillus sp. 1663tsa1]
MKQIKLEETPQKLQRRIQGHVEERFELLKIHEYEFELPKAMQGEGSTRKSYEAILVQCGHATIIKLFGRIDLLDKFVVDEHKIDAFDVIEAMQASERFRNEIKSYIRTIERDIERKEKEQGE